MPARRLKRKDWISIISVQTFSALSMRKLLMLYFRHMEKSVPFPMKNGTYF